MDFRFKLLFLAFIFFFISSCGEHRKNFLEYQADFNPEKIEVTENVIVKFANKNRLRIFNKDKNNMEILSREKKAFYIALYFEGDPIISVTNVGAAVKLSLSSVDYGNMTEAELTAITIALVDVLQQELDINLRENKNIKQNSK